MALSPHHLPAAMSERGPPGELPGTKRNGALKDPGSGYQLPRKVTRSTGHPRLHRSTGWGWPRVREGRRHPADHQDQRTQGPAAGGPRGAGAYLGAVTAGAHAPLALW